MTRTKRLQPVQDVVESNEKRLAQSLAGYERRVSEAEKKLAELTRYRGEYEQQFTQRAGGGMGVMELRDYQAFLARLNEAARQQQAVVQRVRVERDAERAKWQEAARRVKAIDHVVAKWQTEERLVADRREQRETDERGQRRPKTDL